MFRVGQVTFDRKRNRVHPSVQLGVEPQISAVNPVPAGRVRIGNGNTIREFTVVSQSESLTTVTSIGNCNFIMSHCVLHHNATVGDDCLLANGCIMGDHTTIQNNVVVGARVVVLNQSVIGAYAKIKTGAVVRVHIPPFACYNPSHPLVIRKINVSGMQAAGFSPAEILSVRSHYCHQPANFTLRLRQIFLKFKQQASGLVMPVQLQQ